MTAQYLVDTDWAIHYLNDHPEISQRLDELKAEGLARGRLRAARMVVGDFDLLIGATALRHNLTLLSNNRRHFELVEGLRLQSL